MWWLRLDNAICCANAAAAAAFFASPKCTYVKSRPSEFKQVHICESSPSELTTNGIASVATIAVVASGNAAIATVVTTVATSSIGIVTIATPTIASVATNGNIASAAMTTSTSLLVHIVVACLDTQALP